MASNSGTAYPTHGSPTAQAREQRRRHWQDVVARWKKSGLSMVAFSRQEGIKDGTLAWWVSKLRRLAEAAPPKSKAKSAVRPAFVPVRVIEATPSAGGGSAVEVVTRDGHVIRVQAGFDPAVLRQVVAALEGRP